MVASALVSARVSPVVTVPSKVSNWPRTLVIRWRTVKPTSEWLGSMVQVPATRPGTEVLVGAVVVMGSSSRIVEF